VNALSLSRSMHCKVRPFCTAHAVQMRREQIAGHTSMPKNSGCIVHRIRDTGQEMVSDTVAGDRENLARARSGQVGRTHPAVRELSIEAGLLRKDQSHYSTW
jgi:hypothetical protein